MKVYEINENLAKQAKETNSFDDYVNGSATEDYSKYLTRFNKVVDDLVKDYSQNINDEVLDLIEYYKDKYAKKLALAINKSNSIESSMPSIMITGGGNFNVRKKEKQNRAREKFWNEYGDLFEEDNYYLKRIKGIIKNNAISSTDAMAVEKLQTKIEDLEEMHNLMKQVNEYYRKNKTLDGCDLLSEQEIEKIKINMARFSINDIPFASYKLANNSANIRRLKDRVKSIQKMKGMTKEKIEEKYIEVKGLKVQEDANDMRIRILFDNIPSTETRELLKRNGFKWSPKNSAWQRLLNENGICATKRILKIIKNLVEAKDGSVGD